MRRTLYDLQAGISGWSDRPEEVLQDFGRAWRKERNNS
jgi:hypothetical protein